MTRRAKKAIMDVNCASSMSQGPHSLHPFQQKVWAALRTIPTRRGANLHGHRRPNRRHAVLGPSISKVNNRARPTPAEKNPYAPEVPCHRVIRSDGSIGGYSAEGGSEKKRAMLREEGVHID